MEGGIFNNAQHWLNLAPLASMVKALINSDGSRIRPMLSTFETPTQNLYKGLTMKNCSLAEVCFWQTGVCLFSKYYYSFFGTFGMFLHKRKPMNKHERRRNTFSFHSKLSPTQGKDGLAQKWVWLHISVPALYLSQWKNRLLEYWQLQVFSQ